MPWHLVVNVLRWVISNNSFFKLATGVFAFSCAITLIRFEYLNFFEVLFCLG